MTRGAVAAVPGDVPSSPAQAQAWELRQDAAARYGDQWGGLIDLPLSAEPPAAAAGPAVDQGTGSRLAAVLAGCGANQVAIRQGGAFTRRPPDAWRYRDGLGGAGERAAAGGQDRGVSGADAKLVRELAAVPEVTQLRMLTDLVRTHAAAVLRYPSAESVAPGRPFSELGFESLTAIEMRNRLSAVTGLTLPATLLFDYPAPDVLARCLRSELLGLPLAADAAPGPMSTGPVNTGSVTTGGEPVAVVGMSCRFAGGANSPDELWETTRRRHRCGGRVSAGPGMGH